MAWPTGFSYDTLTSTMKEYVDLHREHPEKIILYRFGDFFASSSKRLSGCTSLNGTLTSSKRQWRTRRPRSMADRLSRGLRENHWQSFLNQSVSHK